MKNKTSVMVGIIFTLVLFLWLTMDVAASPFAQQPAFPSPTPRAEDGRIIYTVQEGDTCQRIELLYGVSEAYLRSTNNLDENCTIVAGQQLVLGVGGPAATTPTAGPSPTPTPTEPTPFPETGYGDVCVLLYNDKNGDGLRQETELGLADGAISLTSSDGQYSQTRSSVAEIDLETTEPVLTCFTEVPESDYTISAAVPEGYNTTTRLSQALQVQAGDTTYVAFGAQEQGGSIIYTENGKSPLLGIIGTIFLLAGAGLGIYTWRFRK